jgi:hypothetical protein
VGESALIRNEKQRTIGGRLSISGISIHAAWFRLGALRLLNVATTQAYLSEWKKVETSLT